MLDINYRQPVILAEDAFAGDTTIYVFPLTYELTSGRKLVFPNQRVTLAATATVGATTLTVTALSIDSLISINPDIAATQNDFPVDLTGYTARSQIRETVESSTILAQFTTSIQADVGTGVDSVIRLQLPSDPNQTYNTTELVPTPSGLYYVWDVEIVSPGGQVTRIVQGDVEVSAEVTR